MRPPTWIVTALLLVACTARPRPELAAEERVLLERLGRDPGVEILRWERRADRVLRVFTRQGDEEIVYVLPSGGDGSPTIRRLVEGGGMFDGVAGGGARR